MAGHVFVIQSDPSRLACDALAIPGNAQGKPAANGVILRAEQAQVHLPVGWQDERARVAPLSGTLEDGPSRWLVNAISTQTRTGFAPVRSQLSLMPAFNPFPIASFGVPGEVESSQGEAGISAGL